MSFFHKSHQLFCDRLKKNWSTKDLFQLTFCCEKSWLFLGTLVCQNNPHYLTKNLSFPLNHFLQYWSLVSVFHPEYQKRMENYRYAMTFKSLAKVQVPWVKYYWLWKCILLIGPIFVKKQKNPGMPNASSLIVWFPSKPKQIQHFCRFD